MPQKQITSKKRPIGLKKPKNGYELCTILSKKNSKLKCQSASAAHGQKPLSLQNNEFT